jgi:predicted RNA-binding protein with PUA-like domain
MVRTAASGSRERAVRRASSAASRASQPAGRISCPVMNYLFKEEPANYSFDDLVRDGSTSWTGVKNPVAQKHLRGVKKGDRIFFYHTGDEKAVIGICRAAGDAYADPKDATGKLYAVDVEPVKKLKSPVTLAAIKADKRFASFELTRLPRLSVMPVAPETWDAIVKMSGA